MSEEAVCDQYILCNEQSLQIIVDSEFQEWLLPLSPDEFELLEESIIQDGCRDPLVVWNGILVDGHHRYGICKTHDISFNTVESSLQTREEVKNWIINNQLGRRNVTPEQRNYLIGKMYRETKNDIGAPEGNQNASENKDAIIAPLKTDETIAEKFNVSPRTVHNAEKFADAVDTLENQYGEGVKKNILTGKAKLPQKAVIENAALFTSEKEEWYTPPEILESVLDVFDGEIDTDPCSNSHEKPNIPAKTLFTKDDDGLSQEWFGRTYMNPPYGDVLPQWIEKIVNEYQNGGVTEALVLVPNRSDTRWYRMIHDYPFCAIDGRLKFSGSKNSATFPSVVFYLGENVKAFFEAFECHGSIFKKLSREEADVS
jgi:hypothetical protein